MDWTQELMISSPVRMLLPIPMRSNFLLRKDSSGRERIYRFYEEWWGNPQLNRHTTFAPLGMAHEQLRWFHGQLLAAAVRAGII